MQIPLDVVEAGRVHEYKKYQEVIQDCRLKSRHIDHRVYEINRTIIDTIGVPARRDIKGYDPRSSDCLTWKQAAVVHELSKEMVELIADRTHYKHKYDMTSEKLGKLLKECTKEESK